MSLKRTRSLSSFNDSQLEVVVADQDLRGEIRHGTYSSAACRVYCAFSSGPTPVRHHIKI